MDYIVTKNREFFKKIGDYNYCSLSEMGEMLTTGVGADSETTGLNARRDKIFALQFGTGKDNFLVDCQNYSTTIAFKEYQNLTTVPSEVWPYLQGKHLVFQNGLFDIPFWMMEGFVPDPEFIYDTMVGSQALYNGKVTLRHNFKAIMERELGVVYSKVEQKNIHRVKLSTKESIAYCFQDVDRLKEAHAVIYKKLQSYGGHQTYNLNRQNIVALAYTYLCGLPCSKYKWNAKMIEDQSELVRSERAVSDYIFEHLPEYRKLQYDLFGEDRKITVNLGSPSQMIPVFQKLGINTVTEDRKADTKKGKRGESKEDKELRLAGKKNSIEESVISLSTHEFVKIWLEYKNAQHSISNFGANILDVIENGRIHLKFRPQIDTCRIASHKDSPMNGLNIPSNKRTRECFEANEGFSMIVADFSAQEGIILADKSQDPVMIASAVQGLDLHCAFARMAYPEIAELSDEEIVAHHKDKRTAVKAPRFLLQYGGAAYTMHKQSGMAFDWCVYLEEKFKELHPGIYSWGAKELEKAIKQGYIESADCWRLYLPDFEEFKAMARKIESVSKDMWKQYRIGKQEYKTMKEWEELDKKYEVRDKDAYDVYMEWKGIVSKYFRKRGEYLRLSLNNPIQSTAAHQIKRAMVELYKYIVKRGHLWQARMSNSIYDELVNEVKNELVEEYKPLIGKIMRDAGDYYLKSGNVKIDAQANVGKNWYEAK